MIQRHTTRSAQRTMDFVLILLTVGVLIGFVLIVLDISRNDKPLLNGGEYWSRTEPQAYAFAQAILASEAVSREVLLENLVPTTWTRVMCFSSGQSMRQMISKVGYRWRRDIPDLTEDNAYRLVFMNERSVVYDVVGPLCSIQLITEMDEYYFDDRPTVVFRGNHGAAILGVIQ